MDLEKLRTLESDRYYIRVKLSEHREIFSNQLNYGDAELLVSDIVVSDICRLSGIPKSLSKILKGQDYDLWVRNVISLCEYYYGGEISLLVDSRTNTVNHVSFVKVNPLLNTEFLDTLVGILEEYKSLVSIDSYRYHKDSYESSLTVFRNDAYEYNGKNYNLGIVFFNDELDTVTCRLIVKNEDIKFILPSKYCTLSASRYLKNSVDRLEALSQLVLRVLESMSRDDWFSLVPEIDMKLKDCSKVYLTFEEFNKIKRLLYRVSAQSDISEGELESLVGELEYWTSDFDSNYVAVEDRKSSYIWRCSALSESYVWLFLQLIYNNWIKSEIFYPESVEEILKFIGDIVMLDKISTNLAKRKKE